MPELMKYDLTVFKAKSASDTSQVPASATAYLYFQGADVSSVATVTVTVDDVGYLKPGDVVEEFVGSTWGTGNQFTVSSITNQTTVVMTADASALTAGNRLVIISRSSGDKFPRAYSDERMNTLITGCTETGGVITACSQTTSATTGTLDVTYVAARAFDVVIDVSGEDAVLRRSQSGGTLHGPSLEDEGVSYDSNTASATRNGIHFEDAFERAARSGESPAALVGDPGTAYIDQQIEMDKSNSDAGGLLLMGGAGSPSVVRAKAGFSDASLVYISGAAQHSVLSFKNKTFHGDDIAALQGLLLDRGVKELWIENCRFLNIAGESILLGRTGGTGTSLHVTGFWINGNHFETCGGASYPVIRSINAVGGEISGNEFVDCVGRWISIAPAGTSDYAQQLLISGNRGSNSSPPSVYGIFVEANAGALDTATPTLDDRNSYDIRIIGNSVADRGASGIYVEDAGVAVVADNTVVNCSTGIETSGVVAGAVRGNVVYGSSAASVGLSIAGGSTQLAITGNHLRWGQTSGIGIYLDNADRCNVTGNIVDNYDEGIQVTASDYNNIIGNTVVDCTTVGVNIVSGTGNRIEANEFNGNLADVVDAGTSTVNYQDVGITPSVTNIDFSDTPYTVLSTDRFIAVDASGGATTVTLPTAATGQRITVKKTDATANVIVDGNGSETVDGGANATLTAQYNYVTLVPISGGWLIESALLA